MSNTPYTDLQALPDFSCFQFTSIGKYGKITRQVRFRRQKDGDVYDLDLCDNSNFKSGQTPAITDVGEMVKTLATLIQIIGVYSDRYPNRTIRLKANNVRMAELYRSALDLHRGVLHPLFEITLETHKDKLPWSNGTQNAPFLLKRKPLPAVVIHTICTTWTSKCRLFDQSVKIQTDKSTKIMVAIPPDK